VSECRYLFNPLKIFLERGELVLWYQDKFPISFNISLIVISNLIYKVSPGHQIEASVTGQTIISDDKMNRIRMEKRMCATGNEITLQYFETYTGPYCYLDCVTKMYINDCGCVPYYFPGTLVMFSLMKK